jgi:hypothetical protein
MGSGSGFWFLFLCMSLHWFRSFDLIPPRFVWRSIMSAITLPLYVLVFESVLCHALWRLLYCTYLFSSRLFRGLLYKYMMGFCVLRMRAGVYK